MELIERQAAIDAMNSEGYTKNMRVHRKILSIPAVDAAPVVHGKWNPGKILSHEFVGNICVSIDFEDWRCSICGIVVEQPNMPLYKYCPNCGAKMDGGKDDI